MTSGVTPVDPVFLYKLYTEFSKLSQAECRRKICVYATFFWSLVCVNLVDPQLQLEHMRDSMNNAEGDSASVCAENNYTEEAGDGGGVVDCVDVEVLKAFVHQLERNISCMEETIEVIQDFGLAVKEESVFILI
jgi:hypothetical protein